MGAVDPVGDLDIRPGVRMLAIFPHMNYKPWYALAELVDNAIQSYLDNKTELRRVEGSSYRLRVEIALNSDDGGSLRITDNAAGIATKDFKRAFVTAEPPPSSAGLSQFGIGMKSASCWFAKKFTVRTKALDETIVRTVRFDVGRITRDGTERLTPTISNAPRTDHFTEVQLTDLYRPPEGRTVGKMKDHLESIYRVFLRRGELDLRFRNETLAYDEPDVLEAPRADDGDGRPIVWRKEIAFDLPGGRSVHGFAGIRKIGSTAKAGFALFRHDRLVQGSDDEGYRPARVFGGGNTYRSQRLFGEFHMVGFDVSHTKDVFLWGNTEQAFLDKLREELDCEPMPLLRQAENYRARGTTELPTAQIEKAAASTLQAVRHLGPAVEAQLAVTPEVAVPENLPSTTSVSRKDVRLDVHGERWIVTLDLTSDPAMSDWLDVFDTEAGPAGSRVKPSGDRRLGIRVSLRHPFMVRFGGTTAAQLEPLLRLATGLALAETTAREASFQLAGVIRVRLNALLRDALSEPSNFIEVAADE